MTFAGKFFRIAGLHTSFESDIHQHHWTRLERGSEWQLRRFSSCIVSLKTRCTMVTRNWLSSYLPTFDSSQLGKQVVFVGLPCFPRFIFCISAIPFAWHAWMWFWWRWLIPISNRNLAKGHKTDEHFIVHHRESLPHTWGWEVFVVGVCSHHYFLCGSYM